MWEVNPEEQLKQLDQEQFLNQCCTAVHLIVKRLTQFCTAKAYETETFLNLTNAFKQSYYAIQKPVSYAYEYRERVCHSVLAQTSVTYALGTLYSDLVSLVISCDSGPTNVPINQKFLIALVNIQTAFCNYLDVTPIFGKKLVFCKTYTESVRKVLSQLLVAVKEKFASKELNVLIEYTIGGLYNALRHQDSEIMLRVIQLELLEVVRPYTSCDDPKIQMAAYMFLAYTETEKSALDLCGAHVADILIDSLNIATKNVHKRGRGYSLLELVKAVYILAQNDTNKRTLVQKGILSCLKKVLESDEVDEIEGALMVLWTLSFDSENETPIQQELGNLLPTVQKKLSKIDLLDKQSKHTASNALNLSAKQQYTLQDVEPHQETDGCQYEDERDMKILNEKRKIEAAKRALDGLQWKLGLSEVKKTVNEHVPAATGKHVMVSYNHQHKQIASEIAFRLKQNDIEVWFDLDNMKAENNLLDGMAKAVENSFLVLILFSKAYKDSPNTRSEAEYALAKRKPLLFLRVQPAYTPDGWLGMMLGKKVYLDFSGKYPFERKIEELLFRVDNAKTNVLGSSGSTTTIEPSTQRPGQSEGNSKVFDVPKGNDEKISEPPFASWDEEETSQWLKQWNAEWHGQEALKGEHLVFLLQLEKDSLTFFYEKLVQFGGLTNLTLLMSFITALRKLPLHSLSVNDP